MPQNPTPAAAGDTKASDHFQSDFAEATLKAVREDGLYRHVEFAAPKSMSHLILVTWPYNLLVAGSHGSFHFERFGPDTEDMFAWLRGIRVEPDRWASKLVNGRSSVAEYDRSRMITTIKERVAEAIENDWAPEGLEHAVRQEILGSHRLDMKDTAFQLLSGFEHGGKYEAKCECGKQVERDSYGAALTWRSLGHDLNGLGGGHDVEIRQTAGFDFDDLSEWDVDKLSYPFVYQCHAASWAIGQYDAASKPVAARAPR
ncbi:hypothetical protein [Streptomyces albipurpureus]|uniref:DUF4375 domain-containing protein n=1 Tax=Streptomyces albipurpureus TaxID=2897419 RepID=A0ABT0UZ95_9ACTN|nr:hypothetical protein [Streptomyces sp. CWNU-1]MCM2392633.1 hypothetical protein [Streptomyces sp. CWNU-1]